MHVKNDFAFRDCAELSIYCVSHSAFLGRSRMLLESSDVPQILRRKYISSGYRPLNRSIQYYLLSAFKLHNECVFFCFEKYFHKIIGELLVARSSAASAFCIRLLRMVSRSTAIASFDSLFGDRMFVGRLSFYAFIGEFFQSDIAPKWEIY